MAVFLSAPGSSTDWTESAPGRWLALLLNTTLNSYVIGDGEPGTSASDPNGRNGGWLIGDGGSGWDSTAPGSTGGNGGSTGLFGSGGRGGSGGASAPGGNGGAGGLFVGDGGSGGDGGAALSDTAGGAGGSGGTARAVFSGTGGTGGHGNDGSVGGVGGDGGDATGMFGSGGRGGNGGDGHGSELLPALGGAGGTTTRWFGTHGSAGLYGSQRGIDPAPAPTRFQRTGPWFTDKDGKTVILRGMNVVDITDPIRPPHEEGFDDDDAAFLAANGFNAVRLGVDWTLLQPHPGVYDDGYLASLEETVQLLADHEIVSLLDLHQNVPPPYVTGDLPDSGLSFPMNVFFDSAKNQAIDNFWANHDGPTGHGQLNEYANMLQHLAHFFNGNPDVLGIEIMNEPLPGSQFLLTILGSSYHEAQQLTPFYNQMAAAIRSVNPDVTIFFEPSVLASAMVPIRLGSVDDADTALSFHDYAFRNFDGIVLPSVGTIADTAAEYADAHDIPALMTEFGSSSNQSSLDQTLDPADEHLLGWLEWSYSNTGYLGVDGTTEWLVDDPAKPLSGDNVNWSNLRTLTRPYAQTVAGIPTSMTYSADGAFELVYSTARADGRGRFATGSTTVVSVPSVHYPGGYTVTTSGGTVVSGKDASTLVIASDSAAATVHVTVTPAR